MKVATKFGIVRQHGEYRRTLDNSARYARQSCEGSLRRLGIEQIDLTMCTASIRPIPSRRPWPGWRSWYRRAR